MDDVTLTLPTGSAVLRRAVLQDLTAIVGLLSDDSISASRGDTGSSEDRPAYERAGLRQASRPRNRPASPAHAIVAAKNPVTQSTPGMWVRRAN